MGQGRSASTALKVNWKVKKFYGKLLVDNIGTKSGKLGQDRTIQDSSLTSMLVRYTIV